MFRLGRILISAAAGLSLPLLIVASTSAQTHTVEPGDSLSYIANLYQVTIDELVKLNHIANPDLIFSGQPLEVPGGVDTSALSSGSGETYTIQAGDTLSNIASNYGVSIDDLAQANGIDDPSFIVEGETLVIPGPPPATVAPDAVPYVPPPLQFPPMPYDPEIEAIIEEMAGAYGVDPNLVKAVATIESGWNELAVSYTDARGVMQIMPGTAQYLEDDVFGYDLNYDTSAYDNIKMGTKYLALLLEYTGGDDHLAVASYYQGLSPTQAGVFYPDTTDYVQMIFRVRDTYWPA